MSTKLILLLIFVGLACYVLGRRSARRGGGGGGGEPMLQTSAPRALVPARTATATHDAALDAASLAEVKRLIGERRLIEAIRIYRERTNCGLREAKEACESIAESLSAREV
jgi:hypothetical protein